MKRKELKLDILVIFMISMVILFTIQVCNTKEGVKELDEIPDKIVKIDSENWKIDVNNNDEIICLEGEISEKNDKEDKIELKINSQSGTTNINIMKNEDDNSSDFEKIGVGNIVTIVGNIKDISTEDNIKVVKTNITPSKIYVINENTVSSYNMKKESL